MRFSVMALCLVCISVMVFPVHAEIPQMINYQGKVTDSVGDPVADGTYTMRFRLYDDETGNILLWDSGDLSVNLEDGVFSVYLGDTSLNPILLSFDIKYWLLVTFEGDDQAPRKPLSSVGYAYMASGLVPGTEVSGDVTTGTLSAIKGANTATSGMNYGLFGESASTSGAGIHGTATATSGVASGGFFLSSSASGRGVYGETTATSGSTYGGYFTTSSINGIGVFGGATSLTGTTYGVRGSSSSTSGRGVYGTASAGSGTTYGVSGTSNSTDGTGVHGLSYASSGTTHGVYGESYSTDGYGVYGYVSATTGDVCGVMGESISSSGYGVLGYGKTGVLGVSDISSSTGIWGIAVGPGEPIGVFGETDSEDGIGVFGANTSTEIGGSYGGYFYNSTSDGTGVYGIGNGFGVYGESPGSDGIAVSGQVTASYGTNFGVKGQSASTSGRGVYGLAHANSGEPIGVWGGSISPSGKGVSGYNNATSGGTGVYGLGGSSNGTSYGVYGRTNSSTGFGVYYEGGLAGSGTKSCVVKTSQGPTLMYCQESPENWFEDFGEGQLVNGRCSIDLDPLFLETVTIDESNPMHVFVQPYDEDCREIVVKRGKTSFEVVNPDQSDATGAFSYRVVAKRRGFEARRLDICEAARMDAYLYPELAEKDKQELKAERIRAERERIRTEEQRVSDKAGCMRLHDKMKRIGRPRFNGS